MANQTEFVPESIEDRTGLEHLSNADRTTGRYTGQQVAGHCNVSEGAIRKWLTRVGLAVPYDWLKVSGRYTELGSQLMQDYADRVSRGSTPFEDWVQQVRNWFEVQPRTVEVVDADVALQSNDRTATALDNYLAQLDNETALATRQVDQLVDDLEADEMAMFQAQIEAARHKGQKKATILYGVEKQAENEAMQALRQREIARKRGETQQ